MSAANANDNHAIENVTIDPHPTAPPVKSWPQILKGLPLFHTFDVLSLLLMGSHALYCIARLYNSQYHSLYMILPIIVGGFGAYLGMFFELEFKDYAFAELIRKVRMANVPITLGLFTYAAVRVCYPAIDDAALQMLAVLMTLATVSIAFMVFCYGPDLLGSGHSWLTFTVPLLQSIQCLVYLTSSLPSAQRMCFFLFTAFELLSNIDSSRTWPFHLLHVAAGESYFRGMIMSPTIVTHDMTSSVVYVVMATLVSFFMYTYLVYPTLYSRFYQSFSFAVWNTIYHNLLRLPPIFPKVISGDYAEKFHDQRRLRIVPYSSNHPLAPHMDFTAINTLPSSQLYFADATKVQRRFSLISILDRFIPQARTSTLITKKHRCDKGGFQDYFPLKNPPVAQTPAKIIEYYNQGQLLAYICQFGHATTMLQKESDDLDTMVLDLDWMTQFAVKPDFCPYGGKAWFRIDPEGVLILTKVRGPAVEDQFPEPIDAPKGLLPNLILAELPTEFKRVQDMLVASTLAHCVVGKHSSGIHSYFNIIAIALHNGFDSMPASNVSSTLFPRLAPGTVHPIRLIFQLHFYNHSVLEEVTTSHLLEEGSVFQQIFAFSRDGLANYYNYVFRKFQMAEDAYFEENRLHLWNYPSNTTSDTLREDGNLKTQLSWELRYYEMWKRYAEGIVTSVYPQDVNFKEDHAIKSFVEELKIALQGVVQQGREDPVLERVQLPARYHLRDRRSLSQFLADAIFCITIRHEIYGRLTTRYGNDFSIMQQQVPLDFGPPAVEDFQSVCYIALATSKPNYIKLMDDYTYLLEPLRGDQVMHRKLTAVFIQLQDDLKHIQDEWTSTAMQQSINIDYCRPLPQDLCVGAAY